MSATAKCQSCNFHDSTPAGLFCLICIRVMVDYQVYPANAGGMRRWWVQSLSNPDKSVRDAAMQWYANTHPVRSSAQMKKLRDIKEPFQE